ncbi:putative phosphatase/phosphohexomutase [Mycobacterium sp. JS623]|uniref:HAD family hydrolase n=1 Tax=Mycobacterium sp. JS623 TaxID=212767 RepID=UPI0002A575A8|nr:HAD family hydrolase [Mycobacterium sp. JS623]AGB21486.1 putative phosphatase/phosphohexomutase [Mycobacterium sp. JS623]
MPTTQEKSWRAGRFWWDATTTTRSVVYPLRAVIFDLDALTDIECDGHRVAYNAAFAAHGLDIEWTVGRYRQLLALPDERQRVSAELRKRGISTESDVLTQLLADEIYSTKTVMFDELVHDADLTPRPGLVDLVMDAFGAGVWVAVVANGPRSWAEPLIRQLVGDGLVETVVTNDDVKKPMPDREANQNALWELGISAENALAITGSACGLRSATCAGLATVVITGDGTPDIPAAVAVRSDYCTGESLTIADCQRLHGSWWAAHKRSAA